MVSIDTRAALACSFGLALPTSALAGFVSLAARASRSNCRKGTTTSGWGREKRLRYSSSIRQATVERDELHSWRAERTAVPGSFRVGGPSEPACQSERIPASRRPTSSIRLPRSFCPCRLIRAGRRATSRCLCHRRYGSHTSGDVKASRCPESQVDRATAKVRLMLLG
jgi:hypothetical protein